MDWIEDEPRKHPKPVPFCQSALLQPTVPEVSLILQDKFEERLEKKNDSFSGTEFQTYNAWRWKNLKTSQENGNPDIKTMKKCTTVQDCCLIQDKYFTSDVEKRKNEILYGQSSEPRRPLPPRASPVIPKITELVFPNTSFDDLKLDDDDDDDKFRDTNRKRFDTIIGTEKIIPENHNQKSSVFKNKFDNSEKLYNIISEQNKQAEVLQKQIEQLLKLQEVKDKQIEQLLKSQEAKENKIKQLLQSLDLKDREVQELLKLKEKQELQLHELIKSQDAKHVENLNLIKKLNKIQKKDVCTVGIMTSLQMVEAETNTSFNFVKENREQHDNIMEENISCIRDLSAKNEFDRRDKSLSLHSSDLPTIQEHVPTPQSSIHVDIQDFHDSSDESNSEVGDLSNLHTVTEPQSTPLGYTFYNNVLTQVKGIIQNSCEKEANNLGDRQNFGHKTHNATNEPKYVAEQSLQFWDVYDRENIPPSDVILERSNHPERFSYEPVNGKDSNSPTDISLKINALALKYLKKEQISQYNIHPNIATSHQGDVTIYNVTNLSFGSMRYIDRHKILPKVKESQQNQNVQQNERSPAQLLKKKKKMILQENLTPVCNVLDISTLNQQPKLL